MLLIPGGKAPEMVRLSSNASEVTKAFFKEDKPVAAICHGSQVLISADVLSGRKATCWQGIRDDLIAAGAKVSDEKVVVDGNLITSRCPSDLTDFNKAIINIIT